MSDEEAKFWVDTAGTEDGPFWPSHADIIVEILTPYDWQLVVVSARRTEASLEEAATLAVDTYHKREGHEVPWLAMGQPFYHVQAYRRSHRGKPAHMGLVRMDEDGDWAWEPEEEER